MKRIIMTITIFAVLATSVFNAYALEDNTENAQQTQYVQELRTEKEGRASNVEEREAIRIDRLNNALEKGLLTQEEYDTRLENSPMMGNELERHSFNAMSDEERESFRVSKLDEALGEGLITQEEYDTRLENSPMEMRAGRDNQLMNGRGGTGQNINSENQYCQDFENRESLNIDENTDKVPDEMGQGGRGKGQNEKGLDTQSNRK